ncbi:hypothetical protein Ccrd_013281 [Cynara cardunculus var. scolymus]|uniref:Uncharacterized protein n=1 Tax=Cynara cardunculus var. scolymus TaxID=59895 RepID=A0A103YFX0_CYNCS|nr:hypothetical protein Ccrd_013281 [Cynara cardunculus var. scolymus]
MTAKEVKFSEAMSSIPRHCRRFSFSIRSKISGSAASRAVFPQTLTGSMAEMGELRLEMGRGGGGGGSRFSEMEEEEAVSFLLSGGEFDVLANLRGLLDEHQQRRSNWFMHECSWSSRSGLEPTYL